MFGIRCDVAISRFFFRLERESLEKGRALGVSTVKFTGEVLQNVKMATYKIDMKRILKKEGAVVGLADGILDADGKIIYRAENLKVGLFRS